jgi:hypothetical protein
MFTRLATTILPEDEENQGRPVILSALTTCLHCHLLVQMRYTDVEDGRSFWSCPCCTKQYPSKYWRIKRARTPKTA